ncbi:hypothetical protein L6R53_27800 [Myxococcota bacterium]|nr:hypothetical protein [Myxococcota bacterium]
MTAWTCFQGDQLSTERHGTLAAAGPGWVLTTDASDYPFSYGRVVAEQQELGPDLTVRVRWQRLTGEGDLPMELFVPGGALMVRDGAWGFYESTVQAANDPWVEVPGFDVHLAHDVVLTLRGHEVRVQIDGAAAAWSLSSEPTAGRVGLSLRGGRAYRGALWFSDWCVAQGG